MRRSWPYRTTMGSRVGRFAAHDTDVAEALLSDVLDCEASWCNFSFDPVEDEAVTDESALFGFLAARGPANPLATVMAATPGRRPRPAEIGIQHRAGTKAARQLREEALLLPAQARVAQDHPRRGLVVQWPADADVATLVAWLFPAMRVLRRAPATNHISYQWHGKGVRDQPPSGR